jgi:alkanesulfonate monooxygenase SsuD/methylene tetrahydromethanopterin reductase-like flavin-dependent oxidoreductase (luciferase family)
MSTMKISAYLYPKPGMGEFEAFIETVVAAEEAGYDRVWVFDSQMLWKDVYVYLSHALARTERIPMGTGVTNPFTRHFTVTASAHATLNQIYPGRVLFGIGRGDSARRTIGMNPYKTSEFRGVVRDIQTLMAGGEVPIVDYAGKTGPATRIVWADEKIKTMMPGTGPKNLRLAGELADIVQIQVGAHPESIRWALDYVREGAEAAGRDLDDIEIGIFTAMYVSDDQEAAWDFCRWSPMALNNQIQEAVRFNEGIELPAPLQRLLDAPKGAYDYWGGHCESTAGHAAELAGEVVDDHVIAGPLDKCLERLHELAAVGLTEVAPGVLNGEVEQVRMVGREVIPLLHQIEVTPWHEVASARV